MKTAMHPPYFRSCGLSLLLIFSALSLSAQYAATRLYTVEDGLPMTETTLVYVDSRGYLWVGTSGRGIVRFDGSDFKPYPGSINMTSQAVEDRQGNLWFESSNRLHFLRIEPDDEVFRLPCLPEEPRRLLPQTVFRDSLPQGWLQVSEVTGDLLLVNENRVFQYDTLEKSFLFRDSFPLPADAISTSADVRYWPRKVLLLHVYTDETRQTFLHEQGASTLIAPPQGFSALSSGVIHSEGDGGWTFFHPQRIAIQRPGESSWSSISEDLDEQMKTGGVMVITHSYHLDESRLILLREGEVYSIYDFSGPSPTPKVTRFHFKGNILKLTRDHAGNYWAASHSGLLWISGAFTNFFSDESPGMPADIHAIAEDVQGRMWFGAYGHGFCIFDGEQLVPAPAYWPDDLQVLPGSMRDGAGNLLFIIQGPNNEFRGLNKIDGQGRLQTYLRMQAGYYLSGDKKGRVLFGTQKNGLFIQRTPDCGYEENCWLRIGPERGFGLGNVLGAAEDRYGRYWMGRPSTGIAVYLPDRDTVYNFFREKNADLGAWNFVEDRQGNLWIGTNRGLRHFSLPVEVTPDLPLGDRLRIVGEHILGARDIRSLALYRDSLLAILTDRSFALLHIPSYYESPTGPIIYHYDKDNGYFGGAGEQNAFWIDGEDKIWFANDRGVTRFDPDYLDRDIEQPQVHIDQVYSYGDRFLPDGNQIRGLQSKHTNISIFFSDGGRPPLMENMFYRYQLNGDSIRSIQTGEVNYANLAPGRYTFTVFGEGYGRVSEPATIKFYIPPVWYRNRWTYVILFLLATATVWMVFRVKQKQDRELLSARLHVIVNQLNPHFINNSLNWVGVRAADREDEAAAAVIEKLAENIRLIFQNSRRRQSMHSLGEELKLVENYFHIQRARFGERIAYIPPDEAMLQKWGGKIAVPLMLLQIHAENALEHGLNNRKAGGWVKICVEEIPDFIRIIVEDNGIGRVAAKNIRSLGTQQGVKMLNELIDILNRRNRLKISQRYEDDIFTGASGRRFGTRVVLQIPKQYKHDLSD